MNSVLVQSILVVILVSMSFAYAAWSLMPQSWRKGLAQRVRYWPWPRRMQAFWDKASVGPDGCGCSGCDRGHSVKANGEAQVKDEVKARAMVFYPRKPSSPH